MCNYLFLEDHIIGDMYTKIMKNLQNLKVMFVSFLYSAQRTSQTIYYKLADTLGSRYYECKGFFNIIYYLYIINRIDIFKVGRLNRNIYVSVALLKIKQKSLRKNITVREINMMVKRIFFFCKSGFFLKISKFCFFK